MFPREASYSLPSLGIVSAESVTRRCSASAKADKDNILEVLERSFVPAYFWIALSLPAVLLAIDYGYRQFASRRIQTIIENVPTFAAVPVSAPADVGVIRITTGDGIALEGCLHLPHDEPRGVILFCPELNGNHWTGLSYAQALLDAGFAVLAFDFRNQGNSEHQIGYKPIHWVTEFELRDIEAVLAWLQTQETLRSIPVGIFGVSRGGSAALLAAGRFPQLGAVATDSGYGTMAMIQHFMTKFSRFVVPDWFFNRLPRWHVVWTLWQTLARSERSRNCRYVHLEHIAASYDRPVLMISGSRDSYVTPSVTREVARLLNCDDCVWIVEKAKHNKPRFQAQREYDERLVRHFEKHLLNATESEVACQDSFRVA